MTFKALYDAAGGGSLPRTGLDGLWLLMELIDQRVGRVQKVTQTRAVTVGGHVVEAMLHTETLAVEIDNAQHMLLAPQTQCARSIRVLCSTHAHSRLAFHVTAWTVPSADHRYSPAPCTKHRTISTSNALATQFLTTIINMDADLPDVDPRVVESPGQLVVEVRKLDSLDMAFVAQLWRKYAPAGLARLRIVHTLDDGLMLRAEFATSRKRGRSDDDDADDDNNTAQDGHPAAKRKGRWWGLISRSEKK